MSKCLSPLSLPSKLSVTRGFSLAFFIKIAVICYTREMAGEREGGREDGGREGGREGERKGEREGEREGGRKKGRRGVKVKDERRTGDRR